MSCASPIPFEQLVAYWTADSDATEQIEEHVFACATCASELERVQRLVAVFRDGLPPVISTEQLAALKAQGLTIVESSFEPNKRREITFASTTDMMIHHLTGLSLADATRVMVTVRSESAGDVHEDPFAPFDRAKGEVLIACQKHFALFASDIVFDVRVYTEAEPSPAPTTYWIPHVFEPRAQ